MAFVNGEKETVTVTATAQMDSIAEPTIAGELHIFFFLRDC